MNTSLSFGKALKRMLPMAALVSCAASTVAQDLPLRQDIKEFSQNPANIAALESAFKVLRENSKASEPELFNTSLLYWSNTHEFYREKDNSAEDARAENLPACEANIGKGNCDSYFADSKNQTYPTPAEEGIWGKCVHGSTKFLPWHRMYIDTFEKVLRSKVSDKNLVLPYWNYTSFKAEDNRNIVIPPALRSEHKATPTSKNSLFSGNRTLGLNSNEGYIKVEAASARHAFKYQEFRNFSTVLESQPHGLIHCAVGTNCTTPDLGFLETAGRDPLFYLHHTNIDRLYQCWLDRKFDQTNRVLPNGKKQYPEINLDWAKQNLGMSADWFETKFSFRNEAGKVISYSIADTFDSSKFPRRYPDSLTCDDMQPTNLLQANVESAKRVQGLDGYTFNNQSIELKETENTFSLTLPKLSAAGGSSSDNLATNDDLLKDHSGAFLIIKDMTIEADARVTFHVYLQGPETDVNIARRYVGTFNLFGEKKSLKDHHAHHQSSHHSTHQGGVNASVGKTVVYDVSEQILSILTSLSQKAASDTTAQANAVKLVFVPTLLSHLPVKSTPGDDLSGVKVGGIELKVVVH